MTTSFKHFHSHSIRAWTETLHCLTIAPTMQAVVVDCIPIVDPQLAPVIGDDAETVIANSSDFQAACPTYSEVIASGKTTPFAVCVAVVYHLDFAGHVWSASSQILAPTTLSKVEDLLPEARGTTRARCARHAPSIASVWT
jgi:hypothetical protein